MVKPIQTNTNRILAVELVGESLKILLVNIYLPVDDGSLKSYNEVGEIFDEISGLKNIYSDFEFLLAGDFNIDLSRHSINVELMKKFLNYDELYCVDFSYNFNNVFTYECYNSSRSIIDHFVFNNTFKQFLIKSEVFINGSNLSDHNAINLKIKVNCNIFKMSKVQSSNRGCNVDWNKANNVHIGQYQNLLDNFLSNIVIDNDVLNCNNFSCNVHEENILNILNQIVDILKLSGELSIPKKSVTTKNKQSGMPG